VITGIDPKVDYAFKKVFGSEANTPILVHFLNAVLRPGNRPLVEIEILNPFNEKDTADAKLSILDIKACDDQGQQYNVEMQMFGSRVHLQRILYYWAILHGDQLHEGDKYTDLRATISIAIVNAVLFAQVPDFHLDFQPRSSRHPQLVFSPQQSIHLLELPKFRKGAEELTDSLDAWCYFLSHGTDLDSDQLPSAMQTPMVQRAMEVLDMLSKNDVERERYRARLKWERDQTAFINEAREQGEKKGFEQGEKKGIVGRIHLCQRWLKMDLTPAEELLARPLEELEAEAKSFEHQIGVPAS
jgi:predicted transposase/invertase (TIGR01784 family)